MTAWSQIEDAALRQHWADGLSASQTAKALKTGRTRNSIIGRVFRLGLPARAGRLNDAQVRQHVIQRAMKRARPPAPVIRTEPAPRLSDERARAKALPMIGPALVDRKPRQCRFIAGDPQESTNICGRTSVKGKVYCSDHMKLCYEPSKKRLKPIAPLHEQQRKRELRQLSAGV